MNSIPITLITQIMIINIIVINKKKMIITIIMYNEGTPLAEAFSFQWGPKKRPQCDSQHFSHCGNCRKNYRELYMGARRYGIFLRVFNSIAHE